MDARTVYHRTKKPKDLAFNTYVFRPLAAVVVAAIEKTSITPNQVTLASGLLALLSAFLLLLLPGYLGLLLAILLYEVAYVLDCADGMLARLRGKASTQGHLLDFLMDELKALVVLGAVAVRLYLDSGDAHWLLLGVAGLVALGAGVGMTTFLRRPEIITQSAAPAQKGGLIARIEAVGHFLIHYPSYIWLAAALGRLEVYLYPYVLANLAYAGRAIAGIALRFGKPEPQGRQQEPADA